MGPFLRLRLEGSDQELHTSSMVVILLRSDQEKAEQFLIYEEPNVI
jgi:hypothetical protein